MLVTLWIIGVTSFSNCKFSNLNHAIECTMLTHSTFGNWLKTLEDALTLSFMHFTTSIFSHFNTVMISQFCPFTSSHFHSFVLSLSLRAIPFHSFTFSHWLAVLADLFNLIEAISDWLYLWLNYHRRFKNASASKKAFSLHCNLDQCMVHLNKLALIPMMFSLQTILIVYW